VPSLTELLWDLGLGSQLVGRTGFCIHPREELRQVPKVGGTKDVDVEKIRALAPTHVVLNIDENTRETADALRAFVPSLVVTHPQGPEDNFGLFRLLGGVFDRESEAEHLCERLAGVMAEIATQGRGPVRRVLYLIWRQPWMSVARETYISRTLARFNWLTEPAHSEARYPEIDLAEAGAGVDEILLSSEPYPFRAEHVQEIRRTCPGVPIRLIDGEMTSWYGSRAIEGLRYLARFTRAESTPEATEVEASSAPGGWSRTAEGPERVSPPGPR
jgi:hypothetical protein